MQHNDTYKKDGVDNAAANTFSKRAYEIGRASFGNSPAVKIIDRSDGNFRGLRGYRLNKEFLAKVLQARTGITDENVIREMVEEIYETACSDGVGTKTPLTDAVGFHRYMYTDAVAMVSSDQTRYGALPILYLDTLDVSVLGNPKENPEIHDKFCEGLQGLAKVAKEQRFVVYNGETAQLGPCVGSDNPNATTKYNIASTMIGLCHEVMEITGKLMKPGYPILAVREKGPRSNGLSMIRKAFQMMVGDNGTAQGMSFYEVISEELLQQAAEPSVLYDFFLSRMNGWFPDEYAGKHYPLGVAHISGGGIIEKFGDDLIFRHGLSAVLDNLYPLPNVMEKCALARGIDDQELYSTLNGGHAAFFVVEPSHVDAYKSEAAKDGLELEVVGYITETPVGEEPTLTIHSQFNKGTILTHTKKKD